MKTIAMSLIAASLAAGSACAAQPAVSPQPGEETVSVVVRYHELDLMREAGARTLIGRITRAAKSVCGPEPASVSLYAHDRYRACVTQSAGSAIQTVNAPLVSALYEGAGKPVLLARR